MGTNSLNNSSGDELSFSEWQFVGKSNSECSDDESIEIIEREILRSETPSCCSEEEEEEEEKENELEIVKKEEEREPGIGEWVVPLDPNSHVRVESDDESILNDTLETKSFQSDIDKNTQHCSYVPEESHVTATSTSNFSRKVLYSCVLAAVIGIIIHQYSGSVLDMLLKRGNEAKSEDVKTRSFDAVAKDVEDQANYHPLKYRMIVDSIFIPKANIFAAEAFALRKILSYAVNHLPTPVLEPCEQDVYNIMTPTVCKNSSGKALLYLAEREYYEMEFILRVFFFTGQYTDHFTGKEKLRLKLLKVLKKEDVVDFLTSAEKPTTSTNRNAPHLYDNLYRTEAESKLREMIEELRNLRNNIGSQVDHLGRVLVPCTDRKLSTCILKNKFGRRENFSHDVKKVNLTYRKKSEFNKFLYQVANRWRSKMDSETPKGAPFPDRKTFERMIALYHEDAFLDSHPFYSYKFHSLEEKIARKKKQKTRKLYDEFNDKTERDLYKRYKKLFLLTQETMKQDYKKLASFLKSKFIKLGDEVKHNYEKLISSDWKRYTKSVLQSLFF